MPVIVGGCVCVDERVCLCCQWFISLLLCWVWPCFMNGCVCVHRPCLS